MRVRLLIDIETEDLEQLQKFVGDQPSVFLEFYQDRTLPWKIWGRFIGAKEAYDGTPDSSDD